MRTSYDKNVIAATWSAGRRQDWKQIQPEFFQLSDADLFKGETSALLTCACMQVGKSGFLNVMEISSLIATRCSCFDRKGFMTVPQVKLVCQLIY